VTCGTYSIGKFNFKETVGSSYRIMKLSIFTKS
jgi:hypothetical protein